VDKRESIMILRIAVLFALILVPASGLLAQQAATSAAKPAATSDDQESNVQSYTDLLRADVKSEKVQIISAMMQFTPEEAATFWPIYKSYDADLSKLGDQQLALIKEYADNYDSMTDAKANELVQKNFTLVSDRNALLKNCYEQVKSKMGAKTAARFVQVEHQLVMIIDLQIASQLPAVK
jgi:hypothetical protein